MHPALSLLVYLITVPDSRYFHQEPCVVDRVHHSVVAYTDAPFPVATLELLATGPAVDRNQDVPNGRKYAHSISRRGGLALSLHSA